MNKFLLPFLGCISLLALATPFVAVTTPAWADEPAVSDGVDNSDSGEVVDERPVDETPPDSTGEEPVVSDGDGSEGEPIVVENPDYDPIIAESGAAEDLPGAAVSRSQVGEGSTRGGDKESKYQIYLKGNKLIKIPLQ